MIHGGASATARHSITGDPPGHGAGDGGLHGLGVAPVGDTPDGEADGIPVGEAPSGAALYGVAAITTTHTHLPAHTVPTVPLPVATAAMAPIARGLQAAGTLPTAPVARSTTATGFVHPHPATVAPA